MYTHTGSRSGRRRRREGSRAEEEEEIRGGLVCVCVSHSYICIHHLLVRRRLSLGLHRAVRCVCSWREAEGRRRSGCPSEERTSTTIGLHTTQRERPEETPKKKKKGGSKGRGDTSNQRPKERKGNKVQTKGRERQRRGGGRRNFGAEGEKGGLGGA